MEDQGKRLLIAVAIAFAIMMLWNFVFPPSKPAEKPEDARGKAGQPAPAGGGAATPAGPSAAGQTGAPAGTAAGPAAAQPRQRGPEQTIVLEYPDVRAEFSSWGGVLKSWKLRGEQFHEPGRPDTPEDMVRLADANHRPFLVGFADGSTYSIPAEAEWRGQRTGDREVLYTWSSDDLSVEKRYRMHPENYLVELKVALELKRGTAKQGLVVSLFSQQDPKTKKKGGWSQQSREWTVTCFTEDEEDPWSASSVTEEPRELRGGVEWAGFLHSYFIFAVAPSARAENLGCRAYGVSSAPGGMGVDLMFPLATLEAGKDPRIEVGLVSYLGPKYLEKLEAIATTVEARPGFEKAVNLGFWAFIAGPLLWLLERFYGLVGSWGIAIVLLTVLVKLATLYWTHKSMKSMKEMARLRPQLDKLREKYKDDREKQQLETMNLFKAHGVNPLAGCLPMLLQMPIWLALYRALAVAGQLYQAKFLWLADLTAPDPFFILPVLMTGTMLLQSRLTPQTTTGMQQKMLTYGMPLMFGVMGFFFPAGLTLYMTTNTMLTLLHHLYMRRSAEKAPGAVKAAASAPEPGVSGRRSSSKRSGDEAEGRASGGAAESSGARPVRDGDGGAEADGDPARNGQRSRGPGARGPRPGRRGGRRKRSSRSS
jgi:YidC/Oxa1 family membrane protein insertase